MGVQDTGDEQTLLLPLLYDPLQHFTVPAVDIPDHVQEHLRVILLDLGEKIVIEGHALTVLAPERMHEPFQDIAGPGEFILRTEHIVLVLQENALLQQFSLVVEKLVECTFGHAVG